MVNKNLKKVLGATFWGMLISFNGVEVDASQPRPNMVAIIPVGSESYNRLFRSNNNEFDNPGININQHPTNNNFMENYSTLVDSPLYNLLDRFTRIFGFRRVESEVTRVYVFQGNDQAIGFAERINNLMRRIEEPLGRLLADAHDASLIGIFEGRPFYDGKRLDKNIVPINTKENRRRMKEFNDEINRLNDELNQFPENRPTEKDFNEGCCVDSGLDDH